MAVEIESHPASYRWHHRFPGATELRLGEGSAVYTARADGALWIILDEGTLADLLPADEHEGLIRIERFTDEEAWRRRGVELASRPFLVRVKQALHHYLSGMPQPIEARAAECDLERINERDHLQPWSRELLAEVQPRGYRAEVRTAVKLSYPEHWPRLGDVDIALVEPDIAPAFLELKCGAGRDALGACAWDLLKLALAVRMGTCSAGYLVAATESAGWEAGIDGAELFEAGAWQATELRERYGSWFRSYESRDDPPILRVPAAGSLEPVGEASFGIAGTPWSLRISRVLVDGESWQEWEPLSAKAPGA